MLESNAQIYQDVVAIISKHAKDQDALKNIAMETSILQDLQVNSARLVDIVLDFEEKFDVEIEDDQLDKILTVGDAVTLLTSMTN